MCCLNVVMYMYNVYVCVICDTCDYHQHNNHDYCSVILGSLFVVCLFFLRTYVTDMHVHMFVLAVSLPRFPDSACPNMVIASFPLQFT